MVIAFAALGLDVGGDLAQPTSSRSTSASFAPSAANSRAEAAPMPEAAPVTTATRSLSFMGRELSLRRARSSGAAITFA